MCFVLVGWNLLVVLPVTNESAAYLAVFLITCGAFTPSVIFHTSTLLSSFTPRTNATTSPRTAVPSVWVPCVSLPACEMGRKLESDPLLCSAFIANSGGFVSANIFRDRWAPHYVIPPVVVAIMEAIGVVFVLFSRTWMMSDNGRRNKVQGVDLASEDVPTESLSEGPSSPSGQALLLILRARNGGGGAIGMQAGMSCFVVREASLDGVMLLQ